MESQEKYLEFTPALGKIPGILVAAFLAALSAGCVPSPPPLKITEPITIEMTQAGQAVKVTDASGVSLGGRDYRIERQRNYLFGKGMMASATSPSVPIQAVCLWEQDKDPKEAKCWPNDRSAQIQVDRKGILSISYLSEGGRAVSAGRPLGAAPVQTAMVAPLSCQPKDDHCYCCCFGVCFDMPAGWC
jgi:hypothetical protein